MMKNVFQLSVLAASVSLAMLGTAQAAAALPGQADAVSRLVADTGTGAQVSYLESTGAARFVRVAPGGRLGGRTLARATTDEARQAAALQFLGSYRQAFGITDASAELSTARTFRDRLGGVHLTHAQLYRGVPVFGAELKSHFSAAGDLTAVNGTFVPGINLSTTPSRTAEQAAATAVARVSDDTGRSLRLSASAPKLVVYREGLAKGVAGVNHLAWYTMVGNGQDVRQFVFVSAHTGKVIETINGIHDAKSRRAFDATGATQPGPNYPNTPFWVEGQAFPTASDEANNMLSASSEIYDLFRNGFGRDSFDGRGATMDSIFNRGNGCPNASWNGVYISFCPGTTTDDVTAHEWGHAYTEYTHGLIYAWQPGALNESYSDIWGETVDRINGRGGDTPDTLRTPGSCTVATSAPPSVNISSPASIAGSLVAGAASFGQQVFSLNGNVVGVGVGSTSAACTADFPENVSGKIAFIDRGTCGFAVKALNAQNKGAIGVIIGNNQGGTVAPGMSGGTAANTIPTVSVSQNAGTAIKAQLSAGASVNATIARGPGTDNSVRWLIGEDSTAFGGAIRDMYNPACYSNPGKVTDVQYICTTADGGGVHSNSGVPNHAYALLVDGGLYNGQDIAAIGLTKAAHIYYRAQSVYQGPASGFPEHADAIEQSCLDLTGANLAHLKTGAPSGEIITAADCAQVAKAALAVELRTPPAQCNFVPLLAKSPPALCDVGTPVTVAADGFDGGKRAGFKWLLGNTAGAATYVPRNWGVVGSLPGGRAGYGMKAADTDFSCGGPDQSGTMQLDTAEITIPAAATTLRLAFDHYVATEAGYDGGNLKISVNGGAYQLVDATNFVYNAYNTTLLTAGGGNSNPMAGQPAWSGADGGSVAGSWGRSIVNLAPYARPGDRVKLRFESGTDSCGGTFGWYVDDVNLYRCQAPN